MSKADVIFDEIWTFVEEKFYKVPPYIKYILSYCGYDSGTSIATIEDDDIEHFVSEVRNGNVTNYFKEINDKTNVLEGSTKKIEDFEFRRGHLILLMSIVNFLKKHSEENGPDSFTNAIQKKKSKSNKLGQNKSSVPRKRIQYSEISTVAAHGIVNDIQKQKNILMQKMQCSLKNHTEILYAENSSKIKERMSNGQLIIVQAGESKDRNTESENIENSKEGTKVPKYTGSMTCPYCSKNITVFYVSDAPRWNSSNFDRHLKLSHPQPVDTASKVEENGERCEDQSDAETTIFEVTNAETTTAKTTDAKTRIGKMFDAATIPVAEDETENPDLDSDDNCPTSAPLSLLGVKSKNIVCYSDSDNSDYDVDGETQEQNPSLLLCKNVEPKRSQIPISKENDEIGSYLVNDKTDKNCSIELIENNTRNSCTFNLKEDSATNSQHNDAPNDEAVVSLSETLTEIQDHKDYTNNPTKGDYIICLSNESSVEWPATVPPVKYFLAHVIQVNDTSGGFEVNVLKKSSYSKSVFGFPGKNDIRFVSSTEIIKILKFRPRNLRHGLYFKDKSLLEYILL